MPRNAYTNIFHLPTKEHQNTSLQYIRYRKLQAPTSIPIVESGQEDGVTIL
jgi:hypothetical protein